MVKTDNHTFIGLQQDISISKYRPEFLLDAHNIRITAREDNTLLTITNEKGTSLVQYKYGTSSMDSISGTILGHCILNNYLVLFIKGTTNDSIIRLDFSSDVPILTYIVSNKNLGFSVNNPIEAIGDYENDSIQKIYFVDGINQPRIINIANAKGSTTPKEYTDIRMLDFTPEITLEDSITVEKIPDSNGVFPSGVIQYAFTYYNKHGQESNIFYVTPLYCLSPYDRGGSPEESISNAFKITLSKLDTGFDYVRIYSIIRTSIDATPVCKRVYDAKIPTSGSLVYVDNGTIGDDIDPTSLLYKGGEEIKAKTISSKDNTLFLGNVEIIRPSIHSIIETLPSITTSCDLKEIEPTAVSRSNYVYYSGLNTQAAGFKRGEHYRLGFQAQYKNGKWSDPIYINDYIVDFEDPLKGPYYDGDSLYKVIINCTIPSDIVNTLYTNKYKRIRPVIVFPELYGRKVIMQGVVNSTLYTNNHRNNDKDIYAQSSWFFRPSVSSISDLVSYRENIETQGNSTCVPYAVNGTIPYIERTFGTTVDSNNPNILRGVEIQGHYNNENKFNNDWSTITFHSPDLTFDETLYSQNLNGVNFKCVGASSLSKTFSDIFIQTSTSTINSLGTGVIHKSFNTSGTLKGGIISGLFYDDFIIDDDDDELKSYKTQLSPAKWMVYLWNRQGSLNNDIERPANKGTRSAVLNKKIISNLRYCVTEWGGGNSTITERNPKIFNSNEVSVTKIEGGLYEGNIDTILSPDKSDGLYFAFGTKAEGYKELNKYDVVTPFNSTCWWKTWANIDPAKTAANNGLYKHKDSSYGYEGIYNAVGDKYSGLVANTDKVRVKYKSTPHIVCSLGTSVRDSGSNGLPIYDICRNIDATAAFGNNTPDALKNNIWIPAGEPTKIPSGGNITITFEYGDTWFSRYDCLKTYPFTSEDVNQVVEIGSFMLESRVNIDGRYDRNRGQLNNTNMSPINFNLFNPVYSQKNNFFNYRILDEDFYNINSFPNQVTWSKEKQAGADTDDWTSITLSSVYDLDGSKGEIQALVTWNDSLYCFQDRGISNLLFNSRVQIPTSDGVPIEISNNYKLEGRRYIVDGLGCVNKYSICPTPSSLYFIDSVAGHLNSITPQGNTDISTRNNMVVWFSTVNTKMWKPNNYTTRLFYDNIKKDLYIVKNDESLCYNEVLGNFTSFMSYKKSPIIANMNNSYYSIYNNKIYKMFSGEYNYIYDSYVSYDFTFISNGKGGNEDTTDIDKIFSNINYRADRWSKSSNAYVLSQESPLNYIRVWDEYQDTDTVLLKTRQKSGIVASNLKRKFRVWRVDIPRNKAVKDSDGTYKVTGRRDRIRNTWCKVKLGYDNTNNSTDFMQFHDIGVQYFI